MKTLFLLLFVSVSANAAGTCESNFNSMSRDVFSKKQIETLCKSAKDIGPFQCFLQTSNGLNSEVSTALCSNATSANFKKPVECFLLTPLDLSTLNGARLCNNAQNPSLVINCFNDASRLYKNEGATEEEITEASISHCRGL